MFPLPEVIVIVPCPITEPLKMFVPPKCEIVCKDEETVPAGTEPPPLADEEISKLFPT